MPPSPANATPKINKKLARHITRKRTKSNRGTARSQCTGLQSFFFCFLFFSFFFLLHLLRRNTGLSSEARTRSKTWSYLWRLHVQAHHFMRFKPFTSETSIQQVGELCQRDVAVHRTCCNVSVTPRSTQDSQSAGEDCTKFVCNFKLLDSPEQANCISNIYFTPETMLCELW